MFLESKTELVYIFSEVVFNPWTGLPMPPFSDNDIALLELEEELDLEEYTPICLAGTDVKESGDFIQLNRISIF